MKNLFTEEDVRTKFVYEWLRQIGVKQSDIELEHRVIYQVGHGEFENTNKEGRYDLLVKSPNGTNLVLFEIKRPSIKVNGETINQAVSYARILKGNMAPVVVVTNSIVTNVY